MRTIPPRRVRVFGLFWLGLICLAAPRAAEARGRIPIIIYWSQGETIEHLKDLEPSIRQELAQVIGHEVAVGYHYKCFNVYGLNLWTWDGKHVLFQGDHYWIPPNEEAWNDLVGVGGVDALGKPIWYRFPAGLSLAGGLIGLTILAGLAFPSNATKAQRLMKKEPYQEAWRVFVEKMTIPPQPDDAPPPDHVAIYEKAFQAAVGRLQDHGIPHDQAEANFETLIKGMRDLSANEA
ncbi:MAG: hypothetical protein AB7I30_04760 [Isosphaeraceae bacterium]